MVTIPVISIRQPGLNLSLEAQLNIITVENVEKNGQHTTQYLV